MQRLCEGIAHLHTIQTVNTYMIFNSLPPDVAAFLEAIGKEFDALFKEEHRGGCAACQTHPRLVYRNEAAYKVGTAFKDLQTTYAKGK